MARKERRGEAVVQMEARMAAGDWHGARPIAESLAASGSDEDRAAAALTLARLRPGPSALLAFGVGLLFFAVVAGWGLFHR